MKEHSQQWHQRVFPTSRWTCVVCDGSLDVHPSSEALLSHLVQAHGDMFPAALLESIAKHSKVERPRSWNECLLCCFPVNEADPPPKRRRKQLSNEAGSKSSRTGFAMKHPKPERDVDQNSDTSDDVLDNAETMARHIAAHLRTVMLLIIRLTSVMHDDHTQNTQDSSNSTSVDAGHSHDALLATSAREPRTDMAFTEDVEVPDADDETLEAVPVSRDDLAIPDADVDFDGVPRPHDALIAEEDEFLQQLIKSGACQAHSQTSNKGMAEGEEADLADDEAGSLPKTFDTSRHGTRQGTTKTLAGEVGGAAIFQGNRHGMLPQAAPPVEDDNDDGDEGDNDDGGENDGLQDIELAEILDEITPNFEGFRELVLKLNPLLRTANNYLVDRISRQQDFRFGNLVTHRVKHIQAVHRRNCPSGAKCSTPGGRAHVSESGLDGDDSDQEAIKPDDFPQDIPLPRTALLPAEFECHLCFSVKKIRKPSDWIKHVHEDIQPFTCTWESCNDQKVYKRKADWVRHENERHRRLEWWACDVDECEATCYRRDNFIQHLVREHKFPEPKVKTTAAIKLLRQGADPTWTKMSQCRQQTALSPQDEPCRFCGAVLPSWKKLTVHLSRHMARISLQAIKLVDKLHLDLEVQKCLENAPGLQEVQTKPPQTGLFMPQLFTPAELRALIFRVLRGGSHAVPGALKFWHHAVHRPSYMAPVAAQSMNWPMAGLQSPAEGSGGNGSGIEDTLRFPGDQQPGWHQEQ
jgi:hypothetical protein